ncbi:MAG: mechanosensitive ion channel family protein [Synechococcus lacustris]
MNSIVLAFDDLFSDFSRPAVLWQLLVLLLVIGLWFPLKGVLRMEVKFWPLERQFPWLGLVKPLANETLLWLLLILASRGLDALTGVAGLALFLARFYGICLLSRVLIVVLYQHLPLELVRRADLRVLRPLLTIGGLLSIFAQLSDLSLLMQAPLFSLGGQVISFGDLMLLLFGTYFLAAGTALPALALAWITRKIFNLEGPAYRATALLIRYMIVGLGLVYILAQVGVNPTLVAAVGGGLSVGLGFGLKEVFSNFISGLWLLLEGAVRPGDVLLLESGNGEDPCEVLELGMRATTLWRDRDNVELVVPNQTFFTQSMSTYSGIRDRRRRGQVLIGAAYRHPPEQVIALLEATAQTIPRVLADPKPKGLLLRYDDSAITYAIRYWIENPMDGVGVASEVGIAVWNAFEQAAIEIPFPQRVVHLDSEHQGLGSD